ncbi:MAG: hypothetical protein COB02_09095 [Candidatus Cloacimonadota bacterium]|nr:MAG: hypothetical protein COB02_09095 [Candidatus Cloacimonadota bacterium]
MNQIQIFENFSTHIKNTYIDESFVEKEWPLIEKNTLCRINIGITQSAFHTLMKDVVSKLNLSHCDFIPPSHSSETLDSDGFPDFLKMSIRSCEEYIYLRIPTFWVPHFDFLKVKNALKGFGERKIILDLRLNTGGSLSAVGKLLGLFGGADIPFAYSRLKQWHEFTMPGVVYPISDDKNIDQIGDIEAVCSFPHIEWCTPKDLDFKIDTKIIILADNNTFSCGELFVRGSQEFKIATVIGQKTAGALVLARDDFDLGYGYHLSIPFATLVTRNRYKIEGKGVNPDISFDFDTSIEQELSHEKVLQIIKISN